MGLGPLGAAWTPTVGAGVAVLWLGYDGQASRAYVAASGTVFTIAPYLRAGLAYAPLPRLRVRARGMDTGGDEGSHSMRHLRHGATGQCRVYTCSVAGCQEAGASDAENAGKGCCARAPTSP